MFPKLYREAPFHPRSNFFFFRCYEKAIHSALTNVTSSPFFVDDAIHKHAQYDYVQRMYVALKNILEKAPLKIHTVQLKESF